MEDVQFQKFPWNFSYCFKICLLGLDCQIRFWGKQKIIADSEEMMALMTWPNY